MPTHNEYLALAVDEAATGMRAGDGGPFGAVIVRRGQVIGRGHNTVLRSGDPTAHAEINAIRDACSAAGKHHLSGAVLYSNFEPCPMCLSAAYWADIRKVFFCADREMAEKAGFRDRHLYEEICLPPDKREIGMVRVEVEKMVSLLQEWDQKEDKILY
jgi:tRNA(Arg) A34 adenosine deaminase TadA